MASQRGRAKFRGTDRFEVLGLLGSGGMGSVYAVADRESGARVALKTIGSADGQALLRFKREFRELRDLHHPNLVRLGELFEIDGDWSYTMELVDGVDFATYVLAPESSDGRAIVSPSGPATTVDGEGSDDVTGAWPSARAIAPGAHRFDEKRLREALAQLIEALVTLHASQKVHRDIKPANVLVDRAGRVVVLDFGLVADISSGQQGTDVGALGTFAYMAPEQASGRPVDARADWYAVGVMLFEALTGQVPFAVNTLAGLARKVSEEAPDPATLNPSIPADLGQLARELLRRDPAERPSTRSILERVGARASRMEGVAAISKSTNVGERVFVGRADELAILEQALARAIRGEPAMVVFRGEVGIGKTHLVRSFLSTAKEGTTPILSLKGRCPQHESVPFKGVDAIVDGLSGYLARLRADEVAALVPTDLDVLARTFPVLRRINALGPPGPKDNRDPREQRAAVFGGLRTLLSRVAERVATVVWIDDAQWLDEDSASLLGEVLRSPGAPRILFLATERADPSSAAASRIDSIRERVRGASHALERFDEATAIELAEKRLGEKGQYLASWAIKIGRESGGSPLLVDELARHVEMSDHHATANLSLAAAIEHRRTLAPGSSSRILDLVVAASAPIERRVLATALGLEPGPLDRGLAVLEALRLVRSDGTLPTSTVEPYHSTIADVVVRSIATSESTAMHALLARAMESISDSDPVERSRHWLLAGETRRAAECAMLASEAAASALAFDRSAELLRRSLELEPTDGPGLEGRRVKLARALANAGRGGEAGEEYERAASSAKAAVAIDLRRLSAEQFVLSGRITRGIAAFESVLASLDIRFPKWTIATLASIAWSRFVLALRGYGFRTRDESLVDPIERLRADVCRSVSLGLLQTDTLRGFDFHARAVLRALRLGDSERVALVLASEAANAVSRNRHGRKRFLAMLERARDIAAHADSAYARGGTEYGGAMGFYLMGEWNDALGEFQNAERIFRDECSDMPGEIRSMQASIVQCLWESGEWNLVRERLSRAVKEADEHGDLFMSATLSAGFRQRIGCVDDTAAQAMDEASRTMASWNDARFGVQRWLYVVHGAFAADYVDDYGNGYVRLVAEEKQASRSLLFTVQLMRGGYIRELALRAVTRAALFPSERDELVNVAMRNAKRLDREDATWTKAAADHVRGCAYSVVGDHTRALVFLERATAAYETAAMRGHVAAMRWAAGKVVGGARGEQLASEALRYFEEQGVVRPERLARTIAPVGGVEPDR